MKIIRASHLGMCFGVRDAIALAKSQAARQPLTILGDLVHNPVVLQDLAQRGVQIEPDLNQVKTKTVMITAHGASNRRRADAREKGLSLLEATCPLVHFVHESLEQLVQEGFHPVVIGKRDHVEVRGLVEDLAEVSVVLEPDDIIELPKRSRFGVVAQTTQPIARVQAWVERIRSRFPNSEVRFVDTVCRPTKQRQEAASALARQCDVVIVIGGAQSNNTRELVATCRRHCDAVYHVEGADHLNPDWFRGAKNVGLTAGTSTPDQTIDLVEERIRNLGRQRAKGGNHELAAP